MNYVLDEEEYKKYITTMTRLTVLENEVLYYKELTSLYKRDAERLDKKYTDLLLFGVVEHNERLKGKR